MFCERANTEDRIEHILKCKTIQEALPSRLKDQQLDCVIFDTWFLFTTSEPDWLLAALYVHAVNTMHNKYKHSRDRGQLKHCIERVIMDIPLAPKLQKFVSFVLRHWQ
jgi:hypothetical protein